MAESQAEAAVENGRTDDTARWGFDSERLMEALQTIPPTGTSSEIVFIDTSVQGYETLLEGIDPSAEVVFLDEVCITWFLNGCTKLLFMFFYA